MLSSEDTTPRRRRTPSFSSSLLDSIYRSTDDSKSDHHHNNHHKNQRKNSSFSEREFSRATMIESWVETQSVSASTSSESTWSNSDTAESKRRPGPKKSSNSVNGFSKTKLKAMKLYTELKKVKQPISPQRIATFLNSIFASGGGNGNVKKSKMCYVGAVEDVVLTPSEVNVSKSCLSKPQQTKIQHDKRSVRFHLADEDSKPHTVRRGRDLTPLSIVRRSFNEEEDDEDEDDELSCASSDLFELDHLVVGRYREELPVYETTSVRTNRAIANGLIL